MAPIVNAAIVGNAFLTNATNGLDKKLVTDLGWTKTGAGPFTYTSPTVNGRQITFSVGTQTAAYVPITCLGQTFYLHTGGTNLTGTYYISIYASTSHVFICWEGPAAGATGAFDSVNGSHRSFFCATSFTPYLSSDTTQANQWCAFGSHTSATSTVYNAKVYVKQSLAGVNNDSGEFVTMRPAVQDITGVGDNIRNKSVLTNVIYWPFVIIEDSNGLRGRLDSVYFGGEAYQVSTGDSGKPTYAGLTPTIDGNACYTVQPFFMVGVGGGGSAAGQYSPVGVPNQTLAQTSTATDGGPYLAVRAA